LANTVVAGVGVNTDFCRFLINVPEVVAGDLHTGLLDEVVDDYRVSDVPDDALVASAMVWLAQRWPDQPGSAWAIPDGWRPGLPAEQRVRFAWDGGSSLISLRGTPASAEVTVHDAVAGLTSEAEAARAEPRTVATTVHRDGDSWRVTVDGLTRHWQIDTIGNGSTPETVVSSDEGTWVLRQEHVARSRADEDADGDGTLA